MDVNFSLWLLRSSSGLTQSQLAQRIGTSRQAVGQWEVSRQPTVENLQKLAQGLRVPVSVVLALAETRRV